MLGNESNEVFQKAQSIQGSEFSNDVEPRMTHGLIRQSTAAVLSFDALPFWHSDVMAR
jgi:hypothetical protein